MITQKIQMIWQVWIYLTCEWITFVTHLQLKYSKHISFGTLQKTRFISVSTKQPRWLPLVYWVPGFVSLKFNIIKACQWVLVM